MNSTTRDQGEEDISPEELKRRMGNLQSTPKRRAAWMRHLYSKKKWKVEYLMGFMLATRETVEREIALISHNTGTVYDEKAVRPLRGMAVFEDERYLPPPNWFTQAAKKFRERVRAINRQQKLSEAQKTEKNDLQMKEVAPPINELKKSGSMSEERAAIVARITSEITDELKMKKNKNIKFGSTHADAHTNQGGNAKRRKNSKKPKTPAIVIDDSDIEEVPDPRKTNKVVAVDAKAAIQAAKLKRIIDDLEEKDERNESEDLFEVASFSDDPNLITRWTTIQDELGMGSDDCISEEEEEEEIDELADDDEYFRDESSNATEKKTDIRGWVGVSFSG
ncbi:hypothetical protein H0H93_011970 [Arthromyces matolae]|nr:hypothetical protein H0H93_011970 [Arthromyces matolae]